MGNRPDVLGDGCFPAPIYVRGGAEVGEDALTRTTWHILVQK
jgi:hypothetical protein